MATDNQIEAPVQADRERRAAEVAEANKTFAKMVEDFRNSPEQILERDRARLAELQSDPHFLGQALVDDRVRHVAETLESKIRQAEAAMTAVPQTDEQRIDAAIAGQAAAQGVEATVEPQIPGRDFADAISADIGAGVPEELVRAYHLTGKSNDRLGHVVAREWFNLYNNDPEMQRRHAAGDRKITMRFRTASMYLAGAHSGATPAEEAALVARLSRGDN